MGFWIIFCYVHFAENSETLYCFFLVQHTVFYKDIFEHSNKHLDNNNIYKILELVTIVSMLMNKSRVVDFCVF
jgi:hypothetical protein